MHWLGCIAINVRTEYSSTLLRKRSPRRRWSGRVGRCHSTQCRGQGTRPATRNHPRTYNTHATGNHPSSLIVGRARLPSGLKLTISLQPSPRKSHTALGDHPSALMGEMAMGTASPSGGGAIGGGRPGPGGVLATAPVGLLPVSLTAVLAHPGSRRHVSSLLVHWGRSAELLGRLLSQPPVQAKAQGSASVPTVSLTGACTTAIRCRRRQGVC